MDNELPVSCVAGLDAYQTEAKKTAIFPEHLGVIYTILGVLGEAGEMGAVLLDYINRAVDEDEALLNHGLRVIKDILETAVDVCAELERLKKKARKGQLVIHALPDLTDEERARILSEGGDGLWYAALTADVAGHKLSKVAQENVRKLRERRDAGVLASAGETIEERQMMDSPNSDSGTDLVPYGGC